MRVRCRESGWRHDNTLSQAQRAWVMVEQRKIDAVLSHIPFWLFPTLVWERLPAISAVSAVVLHGLHPGAFYRLQRYQ